MPVNKNAMTRYALIDTMLANRNRAYSIQDITDVLAEKLVEYCLEPVSKRCVEKDLQYLIYESPFDIEIEEYWVDASDRNGRPYRKRCLRYADPTFSIFKPKISDDEKVVLAVALDTLSSFDGLENFEWLSGLSKRLNVADHRPCISLSKNLLVNSTLVVRLFTIIRSKQVITLSYHTFSQHKIHNVIVVPYLLKEYNNRWFLIAAACDSGKLLTFPLDRIDDFSLNYRCPYIPAPDCLEERYEDIIGVTYLEDAPVEEIVFWVSDNSKDYVATKPIHGSQILLRGLYEQEIRNNNQYLSGGAFFKIQCKENYELIRELTSFGPELIVISPKHIVSRISERLTFMQDIYSQIQKQKD